MTNLPVLSIKPYLSFFPLTAARPSENALATHKFFSIDYQLAGFIDIAPLIPVRIDAGQAFRKRAGILKLGGNNHLAGPVDIAVFAFNHHGCQTFGKRLGIIISGRNNLPASFIYKAEFTILLHAGQSFGEDQFFVSDMQPF